MESAIETAVDTVTGVDELLAALDRERLEKQEVVAENLQLRAQLELLKDQIRLGLHRLHAPSSERTAPEQPGLFNEAEAVVDAAGQEPIAEPSAEEVTRRVVKPRSQNLVKTVGLPVVEVSHELDEAQCICPQCAKPLHKIGVDVSEKLEFAPARYWVERHERAKYGCRHCANHGTNAPVVAAPMPEPAFPGSMATPSMAAHIASQKYEMGMPLYRMEGYLAQRGLDLSRQTMANWVMSGAQRLEPLYARMHALLLSEPLLHVDETKLQVLHEPGRSAQTNSYLWSYCSANPERPLVLFDYCQTRGGQNARKFLSGFSGFLQVDGYGAYENVPDVTLAGCWAHARRKFDEAVQIVPAPTRRKSPAYAGLELCNSLFAIERSLRDKTPEERHAQRQVRSRAALDEIRSWLLAQAPTVVPKSPLGQAIGYCLGQWDKLTTFLLDGRLQLDNNRAERAIKPFVIGRKNWLFANTPRGARSSAILYSVVESAKANGLVPEAYLKFLFERALQIDGKDPTALDLLMPWAQTAQATCNKAAAKAVARAA